jgi:aspartyl-tRNA(Asn)/glutamyl-tRNA(Gln) amidotransferase subunit A
MDLNNLTIKKFHDGLIRKEFSAVDAAKNLFSRIEAKDREISAYLSLNKAGALREAAKVDALITDGKQIDYMAGVPIGIKDIILVEGLSATAASKILENYVAAYDATVIKKLKTANAVFLGKTNLDEFAMGSSTENSAYKITKNPHDMSRVPGGSSGGSAAAVASEMAVAALGTDTGGSIRQPASLCGVVGLKPTYGAVSRYGVIPMASSLDQVGPITKTVEDAAILFKAIAGHDAKDATSVNADYGDILNPELEDAKSLTVGIPDEYFESGMDKEVGAAMDEVIKSFKGLKVNFKKISLPHTKYALSVYYIIMPAEVSTNLARFEGVRYGRHHDLTPKDKLLDVYMKTRGAGFGSETKRRIILGTFVLSAGYYDAYYAKAQKVRRLIREDFDKAFKEVDVIMTPVSPTTAFKIGEKTDDPIQMYLSDIFTITLNLAGLPGISIPVKGREGKLPVGFQLIGKSWREKDILDLGRLYEKA